MRRTLKIVLPILTLLAGAFGAKLLIDAHEEPETRIPESVPPLVEVLAVELSDVPLTVTSQGTVSPRTESVLVPEVSGQVVEVSPSFVAGGFFEASDLLLRIDDHDYRQALIRSRARVTQAEVRLAQERAEAEVARSEWEDLGAGAGAASPLTLRQPQIADAEAVLAAANAEVEQALRNLERTEIRAPYAGRVRNKQVDVGQFVTRGSPLGMIYAIDRAEIRLPLPDDELAFVDLPSVYRGESGNAPGPEVILRANFAGRVHEWTGRIVRTEGEIDPRSRMVHAIASVDDPYARGDDPDRAPLAAGMYVDAEILGHVAKKVTRLPRSAVRDGDRVLILDDDDRVWFRDVRVLRRDHESVLVSAGLADGDRLCVSSLAAVIDGMRVRTE
jgi:RND family efflux transporter MFP subunit